MSSLLVNYSAFRIRPKRPTSMQCLLFRKESIWKWARDWNRTISRSFEVFAEWRHKQKIYLFRLKIPAPGPTTRSRMTKSCRVRSWFTVPLLAALINVKPSLLGLKWLLKLRERIKLSMSFSDLQYFILFLPVISDLINSWRSLKLMFYWHLVQEIWSNYIM